MADKTILDLPEYTQPLTGDEQLYLVTGTPAEDFRISADSFMLPDGSNLILGSDADGDMYYRAAGVLARLAKGGANSKLFMDALGAAPEWAAGCKGVTTTFDLSIATGSFNIAGVGFKPSKVLCVCAVTGAFVGSVGWQDSSGARYCIYMYGANQLAIHTSAFAVGRIGADSQVFQVSSWGDDGVTIGHTKVGSPTGTLTMAFLFER